MKYTTIGHVALDWIGDQQSAGGSALFGAYLVNEIGQKTIAVTSSAVDFPYSDYPDIDWSIQFAPQTTTYRHEYTANERKSKLLKKADVILESSIGKAARNAEIVMLAPIADEITPELVNLFSTRWIGLTPQGWFRSFDEEGNMIPIKSKFRSLPKKIKLIVVSQDDLMNDPEGWDWIKSNADIAVKTMGKEGYVLWSEGFEKKHAPEEVMKDVNPTGCGDIFATALLIFLSKGIDPEAACAWAGSAAGMAAAQKNMDDSIRMASRFLKSKLQSIAGF